ncbi:hypothetical protein ASPVEDRAFT_822685 [Aspergillus versicolor CBS 583.65]|uniref:Alanyl-transfer RNA synthetases family profile domain-containing protein n=1 Tax=Aspergillus versicolor CBS 583.65 TaxID=1036611 RepID=A0A1L9PTS7_ASPVE|nr:uncharacterized protein ASPVEDRAFT_822685 [Aspergillus versicolor CBS 583.65]OJJ04934.1 hypothetical protein ASPVEDRAFT_822685 [Aspergillus versicolor CBS 583.65]
MGPTEALYLDDASLHTSNTQITSYRPLSGLSDDEKLLAKKIPLEETFAIITKQTVFYPQGGGQASDIGKITPENSENQDSDGSFLFEVLLVRKTSDGSILHFGRFSPPSTSVPSGIAIDQPVSIQIDRVKRNYHSRLHTAGHIIGLAMRLLQPILGDRRKVKANHFPGEACMEFEGLLYNEHKPVIQAKVDELVREQLPVRISWWDDDEVERRKDELDMVEGREVGGMGRVRIAEIGDVDANPCGGTHVESTGLTGEITIRKISRQKGISKVSYEVPVSWGEV